MWISIPHCLFSNGLGNIQNHVKILIYIVLKTLNIMRKCKISPDSRYKSYQYLKYKSL